MTDDDAPPDLLRVGEGARGGERLAPPEGGLVQAVGEVARPLELYRKEEGRRDVYYYSKFREGGRVVSEYVGGGHIATL